MASTQERANKMQALARFSGNPITKKAASTLQSKADRERKEIKRIKREMKRGEGK